MSPSKKDVARQFGRTAGNYALSAAHAGGADLDRLLALLAPQPQMSVLDVATGAGFTAAAVAPHVREAVATDLAPEMIQRTRALAAARGLTNLQAAVMDAERLALPGGRFDAVTSRIAPHHFIDVERAVYEVARVLRGGGCFVLEDSCSPVDPDLDGFLNDLEKLRDGTHVRSYTEVEWRALLLGAELRVVHREVLRKERVVADWVKRADPGPEGTERIYAALAGASPEAKSYFSIQFEEGRAVRYTCDMLILRAEK